MLELIIQGRGGQGAQTAGSLLARAFYTEGRQVQAFATYGGARRGTPVSSFIRVDDRPIRRRCDIETPDAILCFDVHLLDQRLLKGARPDTPIVVNSPRDAASFSALGPYRIYPVDGLQVARDHGLGRFINSSLLGAFTSILGAPDIEVMCRTIREAAPVKARENEQACREGYRLMMAQERCDGTGVAS